MIANTWYETRFSTLRRDNKFPLAFLSWYFLFEYYTGRMRHLSDIEENKFRIGASSRNSSKFISERITHDVKFCRYFDSLAKSLSRQSKNCAIRNLFSSIFNRCFGWMILSDIEICMFLSFFCCENGGIWNLAIIQCVPNKAVSIPLYKIHLIYLISTLRWLQITFFYFIQYMFNSQVNSAVPWQNQISP